MIEHSLGVDKKDLVILSLFMQNPHVSQQEVAEKLKMTQPSINVRINKLLQKKLLCLKAGVNFSSSNLILCRIDFTSKNGDKVLEGLLACPFLVSGYTMSGVHNVSIYLVHESVEKLDEIVTYYIRGHEDITNIVTNIIIKPVKDILLDFGIAAQHGVVFSPCAEHCDSCSVVHFKK